MSKAASQAGQTDPAAATGADHSIFGKLEIMRNALNERDELCREANRILETGPLAQVLKLQDRSQG